MPELPEVETVRRTLEHDLVGKTILSCDVYYSRIEQSKDYKLSSLVGQTFTSIGRKGKFLILNLTDDFHMVLHLRMEGKCFYLTNLPNEIKKSVSFIMKLNDGYILFDDTRKFAVCHVFKGEEFYNLEPLNKVGPEPFDISYEELYLAYSKKRGNIKEALLDQSLMSGIGNIYADEILYASHISPFAKIETISKNMCSVILENAQQIMGKAIEEGGSTIRSYQSSQNHSGSFQNFLKAYGHENQPCLRCQHMFKKRSIGGRGTTFCPHCQSVMPVIGLTGTIGTGKSQVAKLFEKEGYLIYDCDKKVRELYENDSFVIKITARYPAIFNGVFSKEVLTNKLIEDKSFRRNYETYIYGIIKSDLNSFLNENYDKFIIIDAPRLFEAHLESFCMNIILVKADDNIVLERLKLRNPDNYEKLIELNKTNVLRKRMQLIDYFVDNSKDIEHLEDQVKRIAEEIREDI